MRVPARPERRSAGLRRGGRRAGPAVALDPALALVLVLAAALAACGGDATEACPGEEVARLAFAGARVAGGVLDPSLDPDPSAPDCEAGIPYPAELTPFTATVSTAPETGTAALCPSADRAQPLYGTLVAGRLEVEAETDGAVLGSPCAAGCVATMGLSVRGLISGAGETLRLDGAVVERLAPRESSACGGCTLPCAARYAVTALPVP